MEPIFKIVRLHVGRQDTIFITWSKAGFEPIISKDRLYIERQYTNSLM